MAEAATGEVVSIFESETSGRRELERARSVAYSVPGEMEALSQRAEELGSAWKGTRGSEKKERVSLLAGVALWMVGRCADALAPLEEAAGTGAGAYFRGRCLCDLGRYPEAAKAFQAAASAGEDAFEMAMWTADARRGAEDLAGALELVRTYQESHADRAELHYQKGRCLEATGEYEAAMEELERACELDAQQPRASAWYPRAAFRLAYLCELRGEEALAISYYEKCAAMQPTYGHALLNLSVLYEEENRYEEALECLQRVANANPQDARARLYLRDVEGGLSMYYDEETRKRTDRTQALLVTPVSDFELSVRSRNCLSKMNVRCLGDLVRLTEQDLLAFKNFGETSLNEIKEMLRMKGLRFGMKLEEGQPVSDVLAVPSPEQRDVLNRSAEDLDLSIRSRRAIETLGVQTIGDLCQHTESELLQCKNFGQTSLNEIRRKLVERGLNLTSEGD